MPATSAPASLDPTELRRQRGLAIAAISRVERSGNRWVVPSQGGRGRHFVNMEVEVPTCSCPDFEVRAQPCKHIFAVQFVIGRETTPAEAEPIADVIAFAKRAVADRPTYRQDWPAYNAAQINEKDRFQEILADLCRGIEEPPYDPNRKGGRPPVPLAVRVFSSVFKVYSTLSVRRFSCDLKAAQERGYISRLPHYSSVLRFLEGDELTPILKAMIAESSLPLKSVESDFAVDSTGFGTSRFARWYDHKYGRVLKECDWVKCHAMTGVKTNVITSVAVSLEHANDSTQFIPLLQETARRFKVREVSADAAYLGHENMEAVAAIGAAPYIAFKGNTTGGIGGLFAKMFHLYNFNRDDYLAHYHKRSNAESTFSMVKAKFGDSLRSKTDVALVNEALCKVLCHNVCCLIQSAYEPGIEAKFWGANETEVGPDTSTEIDLIDAFAWV